MIPSRPTVDDLTRSVERTLTQIDQALDRGDRRAFKLWAQRRAVLIGRREHALLQAAKQPA